MASILLIEDDKDLNIGLTYDLRNEGYLVYPARCLGEGMALLRKEEVDLIILDGNLPDGDGFDFCREFKKEQQIPVVFLTARDMESDELAGFDCGADDYITKPFRMPILHKRIQACLRNASPQSQRCRYQDGFLTIDFDRMTADRAGRMIVLTPTEFKLLKLLIQNAGRVMTKSLLLEQIWDSEGNFVDEHAVAVNINRLRKKIETPEREYIRTLYGMGYQWEGDKIG